MNVTNGKLVSVVCASIIALSVVAGYSINSFNERQLMAKNIETAIAKGIDPLSVRCSYVYGQDLICVAYASSSTQNSGNVKSTK
jgi:hypothetical protein